MKKIFEYPWTYEDFPAEPTGQNDGNVLHAIERIYPFVAQDAGYYSGWLLTDAFARLEITNLTYMLRDIHKEFLKQYSIRDRKHLVSLIGCPAHEKNMHLAYFWIKGKIKSVLPASLWNGLKYFKKKIIK